MTESEHGESSEESKSNGVLFDWELLMSKNIEALEKAREIYQRSIEAGADITRIVGKHLSKMVEDLEDIQHLEDVTPREVYREMAQRYSKMIKEILGTDSVLHLHARNMDAFLDWKIDVQDVQEQYSRSMGLVTRSELSEIHKNMHDLKKEVEKISQSMKRGGKSPHGSKKK